MTTRLPALKGREIVRALEQAGLVVSRGLLLNIIEQAGLTAAEFLQLL